MIGETGLGAPPIVARDVRLGPGTEALIDSRVAGFPIGALSELPADDYRVQAVFLDNVDLRLRDAPGSLYSAVSRVRLDPSATREVALCLTEKVPEEGAPPQETDLVKYVKIRSRLLSDFHGRPIFLRAGVILPRDYDRELQRRYAMRVQIGGLGTRFTDVAHKMMPGTDFSQVWLADETPRMILVLLDGAGPYGDPYQVNSDNNGPYGDAITGELLPAVEARFRCVGKAEARFLDGASTGGWVAIALQTFYPDTFNGAWAVNPDSVDFRAFQLVDIYSDASAYVNRYGFERAGARDFRGDVRFTMRHECAMENVLGLGDSYTMSGAQWGSWNAVYGPRGSDGHPAPLWDARTGVIARSVSEHWKKYDLRLFLESNWRTLGPKLRGKLHIWVGDKDDYFLDNAVRFLESFLSTASPPYQGKIVFGAGEGHDWDGLSESAMLSEMDARFPTTLPAAKRQSRGESLDPP